MSISLSEHFTTKKLLRFVLPCLLVMFFSSIYSLVDGLFISNFAGDKAFVGVNFIYPIISFLSAIGMMIGRGGVAMIAKKLGEEDTETANKWFSLFIYITPVIGIIIVVPMYFLFPQIIQLFNGSGEMAEQALTYGRTLLLFIPFLMLQVEFGSFFVAAGKARLSAIINISAGVINIILDAIFIIGLNMGVLGAALATGICEVLASIVPFIYFIRKNSSTLRLGKTKFDIKAILKCFGNGCGGFVSTISISIVSMCYNTQLLKYAGDNGIAVYGALMYVTLVFYSFFYGYNLGATSLISYNYGAENKEELQNIMKKSISIVLIMSIGLTCLSYALTYPLTYAFMGNNPELIDDTVQAFLIFSSSFLFLGLPMFATSLYTALNNGLASFILSMLRSFAYQLLCLYVLPLFCGVYGIWLSFVIPEILAFVTTVFFLKGYNKKYNYLSFTFKKKLKTSKTSI